MLCGEAATDGQTIVRHVRANLSDSDYRRALNDGVLALSGFQTATVQPTPGKVQPTSGEGLELRFMPDQKLFDGRFATSGWLKEPPDSLTKPPWDNAALLSKKDADALGVDNGDVIRIPAGDRSLEIAAFILPGQPIGVIGLPLGYGRTAAGNVGNG